MSVLCLTMWSCRLFYIRLPPEERRRICVFSSLWAALWESGAPDTEQQKKFMAGDLDVYKGFYRGRNIWDSSLWVVPVNVNKNHWVLLLFINPHSIMLAPRANPRDLELRFAKHSPHPEDSWKLGNPIKRYLASE